MSRRALSLRNRFVRDVGRLSHDRVSSSTTIGLRLLDVLEPFVRDVGASEWARSLPVVDQGLTGLESGQPLLALVRTLTSSVRAELSRARRSARPDEGRAAVLRQISSLRRRVVSARAALATNALGLFAARRSVLTLSYSTEVRDVLLGVAHRGRLGRVFVAETGPGCEGRRLVRDLRRSGVDAHPVPIAALGAPLASVDLAMVGADTIEADGTVVSKVGTYLLALACRDVLKPFYVTAADSKVREPARSHSRPVNGGRGAALPGAGGLPREKLRLDPLFDRTPARLITRYVTESGVFRTVERRLGPRRPARVRRPLRRPGRGRGPPAGSAIRPLRERS